MAEAKETVVEETVDEVAAVAAIEALEAEPAELLRTILYQGQSPAWIPDLKLTIPSGWKS